MTMHVCVRVGLCRVRSVTAWLPLTIAVLMLSSYGCDSVRQQYRLRLYSQVKRELDRVPGIRIVDLGGYFDDGLFLEDIYAELEVSGGERLHLMGLSANSFHEGGTFFVDRIGAWRPAVNRDGVQRRPDALGFGISGEANTLLPTRIETVQQLVERFGQVASVVEAWPEYPATAVVRDSISEIRYAKKRSDAERTVVLHKHHP